MALALIDGGTLPRKNDETMKTRGQCWALLLAAGDGNRVRSFLRTSEGVAAPKQFCTLDGEESLLRRTINRAAGLVPMRLIVTVVAAQHRRWWRKELSDQPVENVVIQPQNRGTAAGILLPLLKIVQRDPMCRITLLPCDHYVADEKLLRESIVEAARAVDIDDSRVVLVGIAPHESDTEYGWILPSGENRPNRAVAAFVEKPDSKKARFLQRQGALLNSLILVTTGRTLLQLFTHAVPRLVGEFISWRDQTAGRWAELETLYQTLPSCDFSRHVLEPSCDFLSVVRASDCGWTDVGTPARLRLLHSRQTRIGSLGCAAVG